jgi:hypothetical protein
MRVREGRAKGTDQWYLFGRIIIYMYLLYDE